jgi:hypothetical protein
MSFTIVLLLIALPVLAICALAIYLGMSGIEDEKKARMENRKSLENELIQNGLWKLVGADVATLDRAIRFLLEDQRARARMRDDERMKKTALLSRYKSTLGEPEKKRYTTIKGFGNWCGWGYGWDEWDYLPKVINPPDEPQNSMFSDFEWIA